ncbi:metallophosphoesterase [Candidatus Pacearchaeota archaeon]|nr:metallophosphoesterase [Candidatus Pacearchaeota archaeon]
MKKNIKKFMRNVISLAVVAGIGLYALSQRNRNDKFEKVSINGSEYIISEKNIVQTKSSFLDDGVIKIGAVSDIEGDIEGDLENAVKTAEILRKESVDVVVIAGDCYENEKLRINPKYPESVDNEGEMIAGIKPYAFLDVPVFVIPGNHEDREIYNGAINKLRENYPNVFSINGREVDLIGINMVGMGGYHDRRFLSPDGFQLRRDDYEKALASLRELYQQGEQIILVTHGPPYSNTKIDYVENVGNVGDKGISHLLVQDLEKIVNLHGHIHEGGGSLAYFGQNLAINVSSVGEYNTHGGNCTILTFNHLLRNIGIKRYAEGEEIK